MVLFIIVINYGTTYNLSFWNHTTKYMCINVINFSLQFRPGISLIYKNHSKIDQVYTLICTNHSKINHSNK